MTDDDLGEREELLDSREIPPRLLRMWAILNDGEPHLPSEIIEAVGYRSRNALGGHLSRLRKICRPRGLDVITRFVDGTWHLQLVRLLNHRAE